MEILSKFYRNSIEILLKMYEIYPKRYFDAILTILTNFGRFLRRSARNPHEGGVTRPFWGVTKPNTIHPHPPAIENLWKMYEILQILVKFRISSNLIPIIPFDAE